MNRKRSRSARQHVLKKALLLATTAFILPAVATAQEESEPLENIVVMGSRLPTDLSTVPGSFQVLTRDDINDYTNFSSDYRPKRH